MQTPFQKAQNTIPSTAAERPISASLDVKVHAISGSLGHSVQCMCASAVCASVCVLMVLCVHVVLSSQRKPGSNSEVFVDLLEKLTVVVSATVRLEGGGWRVGSLLCVCVHAQVC